MAQAVSCAELCSTSYDPHLCSALMWRVVGAHECGVGHSHWRFDDAVLAGGALQARFRAWWVAQTLRLAEVTANCTAVPLKSLRRLDSAVRQWSCRIVKSCSLARWLGSHEAVLA